MHGGRAGGHDLIMHITETDDGSDFKPAMVCIHGGGFSAGGASGAFDFDNKGFKFTARTVTPETAAKLKDVPFLGELAQGGMTRYITFEDVKKLITSLVKEMAVQKGLVKGNE